MSYGQPAQFCRLLVKAEIFTDLAALSNRAQNPLSSSQLQVASTSLATESSTAEPNQKLAPEVVLNLLVSLAFDSRISSLLRKVESDYRSKTQ